MEGGEVGDGGSPSPIFVLRFPSVGFFVKCLDFDCEVVVFISMKDI